MNDDHAKLDLLDRILTKNIAWISGADTKGTLLFAVDSAMLAVLAALVPPVRDWTIPAAIVSSLATIALASSVVMIVVSMFPRLHGPRNSLVYFGGIASHDVEQYVQKVLHGVTADLLADFARQCHRNAEIANDKYRHIKWAVIGAVLALPAWLFAVWFLYGIRFATAQP